MTITNRDPGDETTFQYPDASGIMRTWKPQCCQCDKMPTKFSPGPPGNELGKTQEGFRITDYGSLFCEKHAPKWAENI